MIDYLLGNAPLGEGQAGGVGSKDRFIGPPYYLLNDTFTTARSAGAVNGTRAEPGPGVRTVLDTNSKLSLSGGALTLVTGAAGNFDPTIIYTGLTRAVGRVLVAQMTVTANRAQLGWLGNNTATTASITNARAAAFDQNTTTLNVISNSGVGIAVATVVLSTSYQFAVVARAAGAFYFIKGGAFTNWTLLYVHTTNSQGILYPFFCNIGTTTAFTADYMRVPAALWAPTPLASDGFSAWGTTDGLGHAEGVAGGLGAGGSGLAWTQNVGTWSVSAGAAVASLTGGRAIATVDCGKADVIVTAKLTGGANSAAILARYVTESDYVELRHTGSNVQLVKVVGTVNTTLVNSAVTFVAGAEIRLICEGQKFRAYYNNALVGTEQTIADASLASGTRVGLRSANAGNTFDDFVVRARGTGGEYSALDAF